MIQLFPQIIFGVAMLALGIVVVFFTGEISAWVAKVTIQRSDIYSAQTIWSMRVGGAIAILIGLFVLWVSLRNY